MINSADIQNRYIDIYKCVREYIWDFSVVEDLAELEIAIFKVCPNLIEIRSKLDKLSKDIVDVIREDENMKKSIDNLYDLLNEDSTWYTKLTKMEEVHE